MSEAKVRIEDGPSGKTEVETHDSYGLISIGRTHGGNPNLFGSSIQNNEKICISIHKAEKRRDLNRDWYFPESLPIVKIDMSPNQFAEAITSLNCGSGVPVTITFVNGKQVEQCPETNQRKKFENEFKAHVKKITELTTTIAKEVDAVLEKKTILKGDRDMVKSLVDKLLQETRANLPFIQSQFNEAMDKTVSEAKSEVDTAILRAVVGAGLDAIAGGAKAVLEKHIPKLIEG